MLLPGIIGKPVWRSRMMGWSIAPTLLPAPTCSGVRVNRNRIFDFWSLVSDFDSLLMFLLYLVLEWVAASGTFPDVGSAWCCHVPHTPRPRPFSPKKSDLQRCCRDWTRSWASASLSAWK